MEDAPKLAEPQPTTERLAYSIQEAADLLGVNYLLVRSIGYSCGTEERADEVAV